MDNHKNPHPLRGCGFWLPCGVWVALHPHLHRLPLPHVVVPLRGMDCFTKPSFEDFLENSKLSSPYGVRIASVGLGVCMWGLDVIVPLRGMDCFHLKMLLISPILQSYRPLTGYGLLLENDCMSDENFRVIVPLRGMDCFACLGSISLQRMARLSSPYGVWIASVYLIQHDSEEGVIVPLRGMDCFGNG